MASVSSFLTFALCLLPYALTSVSPQTPQFRAETRTVPVYATVVDARGQLVTTLNQSDFEINDNGRKQPITLFTSGNQAITAAILLDRSPSLFPVESRSQGAITAFAHRLLPGDQACLGSFGHVVSLDPTLTRDADALVRHLGDDVPYPAGTALWDAIEAGRVALEHEGGRRVILVVSDAEDNCSRVDVDATRTALEREGVMVYAIGLRGREGLDTGELGALARATGGWYFELKPADDLAATVQRVADELHRQYLIGFTPQALDGKTHRIDVKVPRGGFTVHARKSYVASGAVR